MKDYNTTQRQLFLRGRRPLPEALVTALYVAGFFLLYGIVGTMDYEDAVEADQHYTEMVCDGVWPDYEGRKPDCSARSHQPLTQPKAKEHT